MMPLGGSSRRAATMTLLVVALCIQLILSPVNMANGQESETDDQFQDHHQNIERISARTQAAAPPALAHRPAAVAVHQNHHSQVVDAAPHHAPPPPTRSHHSAAAAPRKPNRITLVPRRDPTESAPLAVVAATPPVTGPQTLVAAARPLEPTFSALAPSSQPIYSSAAAAIPEQPQPQPQPALASFRSAGSSVSARHSALIAQVAAERAAAGALDTPLAPPPLSHSSLGSPLEALSSPPVAVAPAAGHHHHHHQHQVAQAARVSAAFVNQPEEPQVAPSFEQVLGQGCPPRGVFSYENKDHCDRYYICTNGTFTEEACPNGLAYSQQGAVYQHCAYNWNVDCGRKKTAGPMATAGCPWQFGIFPIEQNGRCSIDYFVCEWGVPETRRCSPEGLFYDDRIKGCQWADQLGCKSEALLNFKCPAEDEDNPYWPYPRYYHTNRDVIVCVNEQPRLVHCNEDQLVDPSSLACIDVKKKKSKKFQ